VKISKIQKVKDSKKKSGKNHNDKNIFKEIRKHLVYDKFRWGTAYMVTESKVGIQKHRISVQHRQFGQTFFHIKIDGRWQRVKHVFKSLKAEGLVKGTTNIIKALRRRSRKLYPNTNKISLLRQDSQMQ
jgi:hypothetical protein